MLSLNHNNAKGIHGTISSVLVMLIVPAYAGNQTRTQRTEWVTYDDPILGISVQYPEGWIIEESPSL